MGCWIDPAWEYWVPEDPEVAELLAEAARIDPIEGLGLDTFRAKKHGTTTGMRLGRGDPDRFRTWLARERVRAERERMAEKRCPTCKGLFQPRTADRVYCSLRCAGRAGRVLPESVACATCGAGFRPDREAARFCSRACAARAGGRRATFDVAKAAALYEAGVPVAEIARDMGVQPRGVQKALRKAGVKARARA